MSFMCDYENEIFTKDIEDLKDFKELGMELQEIKKVLVMGIAYLLAQVKIQRKLYMYI